MDGKNEKDLLLHTCCGPCASGCIGVLMDAGRKFTMYFSNSNLADKAEYEKRLAAAKQVAERCHAELIADPYDHPAWLEAVKGMEQEPERGVRCKKCFAFSLARTAQIAEQKGMAFATT